MMNFKKLFFGGAFALVLVASCKREEPSDGGEISATPTEVSLLADGTSQVKVSVTATADWSVVKADGSAWISTVPLDDNTVLVSAGANGVSTIKEGEFYLVCGSAKVVVSVCQDAAEIDEISVSEQSLQFDYEGSAAQELTVSSSADWEVTVSEEYPWITVAPVSGTEGESTISVSVAENTGFESRTGEFKLSCGKASATVSVSQEGMPLPAKLIYVRFGSDKFLLSETGQDIYEAVVDRPATGTFDIEIDGETYGFLSHSGAGGLGDDCQDPNSALPLESLGSISYKFVVNKATGSMDKSEARCPFTLSYEAAGKMKVRVNTGGDVPTYYIQDYIEDPSVVYDEQFDLLLGGGSYSIAIKTYTTPKGSDGKGNAYGQWTTLVEKFTQPDFNVAVWTGDDATATKGLCREFLEALDIADWVGVEGSNFGYQFQALHIGASACNLAAVYSPKFTALSSSTDVEVTLDMFRFAAGTTDKVFVEVVGGGQITEGRTTVDYIDWSDRTPKTQNWSVPSPVTSYTLVDNEYFSHTTKWGDSSASSANAKILKPISHMIFTIRGATPETQLYISSGADQRLQIHGLKVVKK